MDAASAADMPEVVRACHQLLGVVAHKDGRLDEAVACSGVAEHSGERRSIGGSNMHATKGDHLMVEGRKDGTQTREGEIFEVRGQDGASPYVVRWTDGHEGQTFPVSPVLLVRRGIGVSPAARLLVE